MKAIVRGKGWHSKVGGKDILLGRRRFLYSRDETVQMGGWTFHLSPGFHLIAGGDENTGLTWISLYQEAEKVAQITLTHRCSESDLTVHAVASDVLLNISLSARAVTIAEKS